jgi:hypothetical protein
VLIELGACRLRVATLGYQCTNTVETYF